MDVKAWISNPKVIAKSKKGYAHFDLRTDITKVSEYVTNPEKVARHSFYPFIHYVKRMDKYNKKTGVKQKKREICYAAHLDRCIYQYYSALLNENYNSYLKEQGISSVPVAYRTDLQKSNIHIAKEAFQFIRENKNCLVLIGDFTGFFDCLDHHYLKQQWCKVMGYDFLPPDHYAVFKNVTRYSCWELDDLLAITGLNQKEFNKRKVALSKEEYRKNRSHIVKNNKSKQIPQGSPISAVLANIYMIDADKEIYDYIMSLGGIYMRYSDDFIVIVPASRADIGLFQTVLDILQKIPNLELEPNKTQIFEVADETVKNIGRDLLENADASKKAINFLGFTFDGKSVSIRSKTIEIIDEVIAEIDQKLKTKENQWRNRHLSLGDRSRKSVHTWKAAIEVLPDYLSEDTLSEIALLDKEADELIKDGKIEDVLIYFEKLNDDEKSECIVKLCSSMNIQIVTKNN